MPLVLLVGGRTLLVPPSALGAQAKVLAAVARALRAPQGTNVRLGVTVNSTRVDGYLHKIAKRFDRDAVDTQLKLRRLRPVFTKPKLGRALDRAHARALIVRSLERNVRKPLHLRVVDVKADVTPETFGAEIERMTRQGRVTPDVWMRGAVGGPVSAETLLATSREALTKIPA